MTLASDTSLTLDFNTATGDEIRDTAQGREYYRNGVLHRDGGPAIECKNGDRHWYDNGMRHRVEGPAVELAKGGKEWWVKAIKMSEDEHIHFRHWQKQRDILATVVEAETIPLQGVPEAIILMRPLRFKMSNV